MILPLDHLVINSHFALDDSAKLFADLGFHLTPRGYHSLGSINHLIMFEHHYLELIGLPDQREPLRRELLESPVGIDGLVFATTDAAQTENTLRQSGFAVQPVQHFSREVVSAQASGEARFSTMRLQAGNFSAGRVYFCQHHTPEWVWRDEWLQPGRIKSLIVVAKEVVATAQQYARLGQTDLLHVISPAEWHQEYGVLLPLATERESWFAAIQISGRDLTLVSQVAAAIGLPHEQRTGQLRVAIPALQMVLEFTDD